MNTIKCLLILIALAFCSCDSEPGHYTQPTKRVNVATKNKMDQYWTIETMPDGHSYVFLDRGFKGGLMSHNPECPKCKASD